MLRDIEIETEQYKREACAQLIYCISKMLG